MKLTAGILSLGLLLMTVVFVAAPASADQCVIGESGSICDEVPVNTWCVENAAQCVDEGTTAYCWYYPDTGDIKCRWYCSYENPIPTCRMRIE